MGKKILKPMVFSAVYALHDELSKEHWIDPGEYSEDAQRRVVESANKTLKDAAEAAAGAVTSTGFTTTKTQTKRASATTGVHNRGDNGDDVP
jgi:hypothetical protein